MVFLLLTLLSFCVLVDSFNNEPQPFNMLRTNQQTSGKRLRQSKKACLVLLSIKEYVDRSRKDQPIECLLHADDRKRGSRLKVVKVKGLTARWVKKNNVKSGETTLFAMNSTIDDASNQLIIPSNTTIKLGGRKRWYTGSNARVRSTALDSRSGMESRSSASVIKRVLVIRIVAADKQTTASEAQLADDIFGASGDTLNLRTQVNACSYGQLQFEPVTTNPLVGPDGVYTLSMPNTTVTGQADNPIAWAAAEKAAIDLNATLDSMADYVMVCMPPGTLEGWIGYAYANFWFSVYNDDWCSYPSIQMHEIGHNLNLHHSGEGTAGYDDQSCMMGYSYKLDDSPRMCYNGPKAWQLGWYSDYYVDLSMDTGFNWTGNLIGFAAKDNATAADRMIVRIQSSSDTYIHFNRAIGFNAGTFEGADQVLVTTRPSGTDFQASFLVAKLGILSTMNKTYTIPNFNGTSSPLQITVKSLDSNILYTSRALVSIEFFSPPTASPTQRPSPAPTENPTGIPTPLPTALPTRSPTQPPTPSPTAYPTQSPTPFPSPQPTFQPTQSPTLAPTRNPTKSPTTNPPSYLPSRTPSSTSSDFPSDHPSNARSSESPTGLPTCEPSQAPSIPRLTDSPSNDGIGTPTESPSAWPTPAPFIMSTHRPTPKYTQAPVEFQSQDPSLQNPRKTSLVQRLLWSSKKRPTLAPSFKMRAFRV